MSFKRKRPKKIMVKCKGSLRQLESITLVAQQPHYLTFEVTKQGLKG